MGKVIRKQFANFVEFSVNEMHIVSQQLKKWLRNLRKRVRLRTVNYPCVIIPAGLSTTLPQWVKVLLRAQEHRFAIVSQLDNPRSTMQRIFTKDLHLHAYKIHLTQELKPTDHVRRREFVNWVLENQKVDGKFLRRKSSLAMRRTLNLMGTWTLKTVGSGARRIL